MNKEAILLLSALAAVALAVPLAMADPRGGRGGGGGHFGRPPARGAFAMTRSAGTFRQGGFNRWTINENAFPMTSGVAPASFHLREGRRYRIRMRNASDDIHPIHLHRHSFELTKIAGVQTAGVMKDVVIVEGYQEVEVDFMARQSWPDAGSLPPTAAHGFWVHDAIRLCVGDFRKIQCSVREEKNVTHHHGSHPVPCRVP